MPTATAVNVHNPSGRHPIVLVCEHASCFMPAHYERLGLDSAAATSHIAWDPGALVTAKLIADRLDAVLVEGTVSRLLYDLNRPPDSPTAMPEQSEHYTVPGNTNLTLSARQQRVEHYYLPFQTALAEILKAHACEPVLVTIHSFTPVYNGIVREVEIGVLHDTDQRFADAVLQVASGFNIQRNEPYGPQDGVCHTLQVHGQNNQLYNVMLEVRNDLVNNPQACENVAEQMAVWLGDALQLIAGQAQQDAVS